MSAQSSSSNDQIASLLQDLKSDDRWQRERAAKELGTLGINRDEIIKGLTDVAQNDRNPYPRRAARKALSKLGTTPPPEPPERFTKTYTTSREKYIDFAAGCIGWFAIFGMIALLIRYYTDPAPCVGGMCGGSVGYLTFIVFPVQAVATLFLFIFRRWAGFGVLAAYASNFAITVMLNMWGNAFLGIPFFVPFQTFL